MDSTVGLFYADYLQSGLTIRAGKTTLPLNSDEVAGVLPVLVRNPFAARALTEPTPYPTLFAAMCAQGWQDVNFLYDNGQWFELLDMLGERGEGLPCTAAAADAETWEADEPATRKQIDAIKRMTKSHVFKKDQEAIIRSMENATAAQASEIFNYVKAQLAVRPRLYPPGGRQAWLRSQTHQHAGN